MTEPAPEKLNARQRSQQETRRRLLAAAIELYGEKGSAGTTIKHIATAAGVAVGTVYLHFQDSQALLHEVLKLALARLRQELAKFADPELVGRDVVVAKMEGLVSFVEHFPDLASILFDSGHLTTTPGKEALEYLTRSQEKGLLTGIAQGYYRGDLNTALVARAQVGVLAHTLGWWCRNPEAASRQEVLNALVELRMSGLQSSA